MDQHVERSAMIVHMQPVAHLLAVAVERHGNLVDGVGGEQRDHFSGN